MKLTGLETLYKGIKENNENYFIFSYTKNQVTFEILFDVHPTPFELHFLIKKSNFKIKYLVEKGFVVNPILNKEEYTQLCKELNLKYDPNNRFSPNSFLEEFNISIPPFKNREKAIKELLPFYIDTIEESDKLYFNGFIEWKKTGNGKNVSEKNLEKTRIIYPEYYEYCKRENVSIRYSDKSN